jgi:hypothetical protein
MNARQPSGLTTSAPQLAIISKAVELRAAGKLANAKTVEKRAMMFLRRVMEIEKRYPPITRERHMTKRDN